MFICLYFLYMLFIFLFLFIILVYILFSVIYLFIFHFCFPKCLANSGVEFLRVEDMRLPCTFARKCQID